MCVRERLGRVREVRDVDKWERDVGPPETHLGLPAGALMLGLSPPTEAGRWALSADVG